MQSDEQALLKVLECYVLHCIGCLDDNRRAMLEEFADGLRKAFPHPGDWYEIISAQFGFTDEMTKDINKLWHEHKGEMSAQEFAEAFGERFFRFDEDEEQPPPNVTDITLLARRREAIKELQRSKSVEAKERKQRTEAYLSEIDVPVNEALPVIPDSTVATLRSPTEIAYRLICLLATAAHGEEFDSVATYSFIERYGAKEYLTPKERAFISQKTKPSTPEEENAAFEFIWRYESCWALLWALGYIPELTLPTHVCDIPLVAKVIKKRTFAELLADARPKQFTEVLDEADLIYRLHWALVDARLEDKEAPADLASSVVYERRYALNWLISYMNEDWDNVPMDT